MEPDKISAQKLADMLQAGTKRVTVIDVRDKERFDAGHVPGAVNIPLEEIEAGNFELPKDQLIVTYCGGGTSGPKGAELLANAGYTTRVMEGFRPWQAQELPIETK